MNTFLHPTIHFNHYNNELSYDLASYLQLNRNSNKNEVTRQKILSHFLDGDGNIQEFVKMELRIIHRAIAWIGRDDAALPLLYRLAQCVPSLFDSDSDGYVKAGSAKRIRC